MNHECCQAQKEQDAARAACGHAPAGAEGSQKAQAPRGVEHAGAIDLLVHDAKTDVVTLTMVERRAWNGSKLQLFQLQEKFNAYLSFILDGEMAEAYPALMGKSIRICLECATPPEGPVLEFLAVVREQIGFQGIGLEVGVVGCGCGAGGEGANYESKTAPGPRRTGEVLAVGKETAERRREAQL